jgi:hypothetical protein
MRIITVLAPALLLGALATGCGKDTPTPAPTPQPSTVKVSITEAGAPAYELKEARVIDATYLTGSPRLSLSGKLTSGKSLTLYFSKGSATTSYTTSGLTSSLDGVAGTNTAGNTVYDTQTKIVSGDFRTTFAGTGEVVGSFSDIQL